MLGLWVALASASAPVTVAVAPVTEAGVALEDLTDRLFQTLGRIDGLKTVDLRGLARTHGPSKLAAYLACESDRCRVDVASALGWDELVVGERDDRALRIRRLGRDPDAPALLRVGAPLDGSIDAIETLVQELYPERAGRSPGRLALEGLPPEAMVRIDDAAPRPADDGRFETALPPGEHRVEVRAPRHEPWTETVPVRLGAPARLRADLDKRHSDGPLWLAGAGAVGAAAGGLLLGLAQSRADDWSSACGSTACRDGYTLRRYQDDQSALDLERGLGVGLIVAGSATAVGALVWYLVDPGVPGAGDVFVSGDGAGVRF